jgi:hypothetical protein
MRPLLTFLIIFQLLTFTASAYALSCAAPVMTQEVFDASIAVFEGEAQEGRELSAQELQAFREAGIIAKGGELTDMRAYTFVALKAHKGGLIDETVEVARNTYWGDEFAAGGGYLIVSPQKVGGLYLAPLCGHSISLDYAREMGMLEFLKRGNKADGHH